LQDGKFDASEKMPDHGVEYSLDLKSLVYSADLNQVTVLKDLVKQKDATHIWSFTPLVAQQPLVSTYPSLD
jgi:hypothetical protein